jgi:hypothetical protein
MGYPHDLHAPTDPVSPEPVGWCDRCQRKWPLALLQWQFGWVGNALQNLHLRVCPDDLDIPNEQLRPIIILGPEGVVRDPRPPIFAGANANGPTLPFAPSWPGPDFPEQEVDYPVAVYGE